jgi:hypothetical protein
MRQKNLHPTEQKIYYYITSCWHQCKVSQPFFPVTQNGVIIMMLNFYRKIIMYNRLYLLLFGADLSILNKPSKLIKSGSSYWKDSSFSLNDSINWEEIDIQILVSSIFNNQLNNIFSKLMKQILTDDARLKFHPKVLKMLTLFFSQEEVKTMVQSEKSIKTEICSILEHFSYEKTLTFLHYLYFKQVENEKTRQRIFKRIKISKETIQEFESLEGINNEYLNQKVEKIVQDTIPVSMKLLSNFKHKEPQRDE